MQLKKRVCHRNVSPHFPTGSCHVEGYPWLLAESGPYNRGCDDQFPTIGQASLICSDGRTPASPEWCRSLRQDCLAKDYPLEVAVDATIETTCSATMTRLIVRRYADGGLLRECPWQPVDIPPSEALRYDASGNLWSVQYNEARRAILQVDTRTGRRIALDLGQIQPIVPRLSSTWLRNGVLVRIGTPDGSMGSAIRWCQVVEDTIHAFAFPSMLNGLNGALLLNEHCACTWLDRFVWGYRLDRVGSACSFRAEFLELILEVVPFGDGALFVALANGDCYLVDGESGCCTMTEVNAGPWGARPGWVAPRSLAIWRPETYPATGLSIEIWEVDFLGYEVRDVSLIDGEFGLRLASFPQLPA